jgi:hypothetical protein
VSLADVDAQRRVEGRDSRGEAERFGAGGGASEIEPSSDKISSSTVGCSDMLGRSGGGARSFSLPLLDDTVDVPETEFVNVNGAGGKGDAERPFMDAGADDAVRGLGGRRSNPSPSVCSEDRGDGEGGVFVRSNNGPSGFFISPCIRRGEVTGAGRCHKFGRNLARC